VARGLKTLSCKSVLAVTDVKCVLSDVAAVSSSQATAGCTASQSQQLMKTLVTSFILQTPSAMAISKHLLQQVCANEMSA